MEECSPEAFAAGWHVRRDPVRRLGVFLRPGSSQAGGSIVLTTYQAGKVGMIGWDGRQVTLLFRDFDKPMGLDVDGPRMLLATRHQVIELANAPLLAYEFLEGQPGRYDALYLPRVAHYTGDLNVHDVAFGADGLWLVNTRFSCLASPSRDYSFVPRWRPPFISEVVPEDRCHLNGLAMEGGRPRFVTALGETDVVGGWRERQGRWRRRDRRPSEPGRPARAAHAAFAPAPRRVRSGCSTRARGSCGGSTSTRSVTRSFAACRAIFAALLRRTVALVGLSTIREKHIFGGLPVQQRYPKLRCGVAVVEIRTGRQLGLFEFTEGCTELFDVRFLPESSAP